MSGRLPEGSDHSSGSIPVWVYLVFLVYGGLVGVVVFGPVVLALGGSLDLPAACIFSATVVVLGASLLVIPVGHHWNLPRAQRSIVFPLLGSATCAALLFAGFSLAADEFLKGNIPKDTHEAVGYALIGCIPIVWLVWLIVFAGMARSTDRLSLSGRMYKSLLAGSVLELLVAVPMHIVVRRRGECCAGIGTGMGIGVGLIVMLIAIGPAVFLLVYRRYKDVYARHGKDEW
jgi:hypothetical protein